VLRLSDARNFRRTAAGLALIIGPVLLLISSAITTMGGDDTAEYVAKVADRRTAEEVSAVLGILGFAILIPGIVGALNLLRGRGVVLGHIGGGLAIIGLACFSALISSSFYDVAATAPGADTAAWVDISERLDDRAGVIIVVVIALLGTFIGLLLLAAAFLRARTVPVWVGPALILGMVAVFLSEDSRLLSVLGSVLLLVGLGTVGVRLLQQSDEEWDRPGLAGSRAPAQGERPPG
jgi:hypothetical protein